MAKMVHVVKEVKIPEGVQVTVEGKKIIVEGPKGKVEKDFSHARDVVIRKEDNKIIVETFFANRRKKALVPAIASHINNMIIGVTKGFRYKLKIVYSHFPISVKVQGDKVLIENFLGERAPRVAKIYGNVKVSVKGDDVIVEGIDIEEVGQTAANIEHATKIQDFDRRVFMDGIYIYERGVIEE